jgi:hypothetical protein
MEMALLNHKVSEKENISAFAPLPAGTYEMMMVASEILDTKAGTGTYLWCEMLVTTGPYTGRKYYERFNLSNPNNKAVEISTERLDSLCTALGYKAISASEELHNRPFIAHVGIDKKDPSSNSITKYSCVDAPAAAPRGNVAPQRVSRPWG